MGSHSHLQGIFPTQGWNPGLPHCRQVLYQLSHQGSPRILEWVAYPFSSRSSWPGIEPGSPALQADSLPAELPIKRKRWGREGSRIWSVAPQVLSSCIRHVLCSSRQWLGAGWGGAVSTNRCVGYLTQQGDFQLSSVQLLSRVRLFATPWIATHQASLSITSSRSSPRLTSIKSVMPSSHLILCRPLLLLPPIPPSISLFQWVNSSHEVAKVLEFQL